MVNMKPFLSCSLARGRKVAAGKCFPTKTFLTGLVVCEARKVWKYLCKTTSWKVPLPAVFRKYCVADWKALPPTFWTQTQKREQRQSPHPINSRPGADFHGKLPRFGFYGGRISHGWSKLCFSASHAPPKNNQTYRKHVGGAEMSIANEE